MVAIWIGIVFDALHLEEGNCLSVRKTVEKSAPLALGLMWACLIIGPTIWVTLCALKMAEIPSAETSSWVQAFGSILAIWGAFKVGSRQHEREVAEKRKADAEEAGRIATVMQRLAQDVDIHINILSQALETEHEGAQALTLKMYMVRGFDIRWQHQLEALQAVDIRDLNGVQTLLLADLKTACSFAMRICLKIHNWESVGADQVLLIEQFRFHRAGVRAAYRALSPPDWQIS